MIRTYLCFRNGYFQCWKHRAPNANLQCSSLGAKIKLGLARFVLLHKWIWKKSRQIAKGKYILIIFLIILGFTDEGNPCIMDSAGYIRLLNPNFGSLVWIQVCDSKSVSKGKSDHFFMVGANLEEFSARCILVKGNIIAKVIVMSD